MIDPIALRDELIAVRIPPSAIETCRDGGPLPTIAWTVGHPTQAEQDTAAAVLAAHDPTKREREDLAERTGIRAVVDDLLAATTDAQTWANLTAAQRTEATRRGLRALALLIRRTVR